MAYYYLIFLFLFLLDGLPGGSQQHRSWSPCRRHPLLETDGCTKSVSIPAFLQQNFVNVDDKLSAPDWKAFQSVWNSHCPSRKSVCRLAGLYHRRVSSRRAHTWTPHDPMSLCHLPEPQISADCLPCLWERLQWTGPSRGGRVRWATKKLSESRYRSRSMRYHLITISRPLPSICNRRLHKWVLTLFEVPSRSITAVIGHCVLLELW